MKYTPGKFALFLKPRTSTYKTCSSTANGITFFTFPNSLHSPTKHCSASFSFDAFNTLNDFPTNICSVSSLTQFKSWLNACLNIHAPLFSMVLALLCLWFMVLTKFIVPIALESALQRVSTIKVNLELKFKNLSQILNTLFGRVYKQKFNNRVPSGMGENIKNQIFSLIEIIIVLLSQFVH